MKATWALIFAVVATSLGIAQDKTAVGDFTRSPSEHIINWIEQPFCVRLVKGIVIHKEGNRDPLPNVLLEIQGPGRGRKIRRTTSDHDGQFRMRHVPFGTYKFKATLNGFQSVMGTIVVSKRTAESNQVKIEMLLGI